MTDVFLLGAGFSKAIAKTMPTMAELFALLEPLIGKADGFTRDAYDYADGNVETLLSYYAIPSPHDDMIEALRKNRVAALLEIAIGGLLQEREEAEVERGLNLAGIPLVLNWHKRQAHILTTNYDLLVERILDEWSASLEQTEGTPSSGDIHPVPLRSALTRDGTAMWGSSYPDTFTLYKLHGSINWYKSGIETNSDEIYTLTPSQMADVKNQKFVADKRRFIVPPVYDKSSLLNHESCPQSMVAGQDQSFGTSGCSLCDWVFPSQRQIQPCGRFSGRGGGSAKRKARYRCTSWTLMKRSWGATQMR